MKRSLIIRILLITIGLLLYGCNHGGSSLTTSNTGKDPMTQIGNSQASSWKILDNQSSHYSPYVQDSSDTWQSLAYYNGVPYIAFADGKHGNKLSVMKYDSVGKIYVNLGSPGFSIGEVTYVSLKVSSLDGNLYVAFNDNKVEIIHDIMGNRPVIKVRARVMKFDYNALAWVDVGENYPDPNLSKGIASFLSLAITSKGVPIVAFQDGGDGNRTKVKQFVNGAWQEMVPNQSVSAGQSWHQSIAIDKSDNIYVAFCDTAALGNKDGKCRARVRRLGAGDDIWSDVNVYGVQQISDGEVSDLNIAIDPKSDKPYIAYNDTSLNKIIISKWGIENNNWAWIPLSNADGSSLGSSSDSMSFTFDADGNPYLAYNQNSRALVVTYNGTYWIPKYNKSGVTARYMRLISGKSGDIYLAYQDHSNSDKTAITKYDGSNWSHLLVYQGFTPAEADSLSLAINPKNGMPYLAFQNFAIGDLISVMKSDGQSWSFDGNEQAQIINTRSWDAHLKFDSKGTAYLSYFKDWKFAVNKADGNRYNFAFGLQYKPSSSTNWIGIKPGDPEVIGDGGGIYPADCYVTFPFVKHCEYNLRSTNDFVIDESNNRIFMMAGSGHDKFDSTWYPYLMRINSVGNIAYNSATDYQTYFNMDYINLAIDSNNQIYMTGKGNYIPNLAIDSNKQTYMTGNGNNNLSNTRFAILSDPNFSDSGNTNTANYNPFNIISGIISTGDSYFQRIAVDTFNYRNDIYLAFCDTGTNTDGKCRARVRKLNQSNNTWQDIGNPQISGGNAYGINFISYSGTLYLAYNETDNGCSLVVKKYDASSNQWSDVGDLSRFGPVHSVHLAAGKDSNGNDKLYVAYSRGVERSHSSDNKAVVLSYDLQ